MVSGFLTSPWDHSRIFSGDASEMRIALKDNGSLGFSKKLKMSRIGFFLFLNCLRQTKPENLQKRRTAVEPRFTLLPATPPGVGRRAQSQRSSQGPYVR